MPPSRAFFEQVNVTTDDRLEIDRKSFQGSENDKSVSGENTRQDLEQIGQQIKNNLGVYSPPVDCNATQLLPEYLKSHPMSLVTVSDDVVEEVISYVSSICAYYRGIKNQRVLTNEERAIGKELSQLLRTALELL
jgi:hypothetical protein